MRLRYIGKDGLTSGLKRDKVYDVRINVYRGYNDIVVEWGGYFEVSTKIYKSWKNFWQDWEEEYYQ